MSGRKNLFINKIAGNTVTLICIVLVAIFIFSLYFCINLAPSLGKAAGKANGSMRGVTIGIKRGGEEGKQKGLSAKDTQVRLKDKISETGKLQVMMIDLRLTDLYWQGENYAALLAMPGEGIFSVDLTQAEIAYDAEENQISIVVPCPEFTSYLDDSKVETIAEYKKPVFDGKTEDGYQGYLNSREEIDKKVQEEFAIPLLDQAKETGIGQIEKLAKSVCGSTAVVKVEYREKED